RPRRLRRAARAAVGQLRDGRALPDRGHGPDVMGDRRAARLAGLMRRLEASQWLAPDEIEAAQYAQLRRLARHAARHSPQFQRRLAAAGLRADDLATPEGLRRLPPLRRRDVQAAGDELYCRDVPPGHAPLNETRTSGSTGEPVVIRRTGVTSLI